MNDKNIIRWLMLLLTIATAVRVLVEELLSLFGRFVK
jgi:hypothetical protein